MIGQTIGHYRVLEQIGGGGMGVVYRAEDERLGRQVALKLLPADIGESSESRERFRREAELIAALNHPHICTLHDVGEHDGRRFLVFELVDGRTLKQAIDGRPLPVEQAIEVAIDVADALDAAHGRGIVHRDVKPGNVMLTSRGDAKLLDFGIAKREWRPATDTEATRADVTRRGEWVGTPDYMAPEQARGEVMDARADLFALGAVMYEMATGRPPFGADTVAGTIDAVLRRTPERPSAVNPQVPETLERVILKALEKDRALRYQTAREIVADLRRMSRDSTAPDPVSAPVARPVTRRPLTVALGLGVVLVAAVIGWLLLSGPQPEQPLPGVTGTGGPARLVVLPFENQTGQAADDWLAGAFADAVGAALQPIPSFILVPRERVVELYAAESRRESQALSSELARQISLKLRVRYYVHGSYQRVGDDLRVSARLVDVESDALGPQETETDRHANVLALEDRLAARFAAKLGSSESSTRVGSTSDLAARQWVTEARSLYARGSLPEARRLLEQAVEKDARFAEAWALLSKTYSRLASPAMAGTADALATTQPALDAATEAVTRAPDLADGQIALALAYRNLNQRDRWLTAVQRAVVLAPRNGEPLILMGDYFSISPGAIACNATARPDVAEARYREGLRLDSTLPGYNSLAALLWWMDRPVEAMDVMDQGLAELPSAAFISNWRHFNMLFANRLDEAETLLKQAADGGPLQVRDGFISAMAALKRKRFTDADALLRRSDAVLKTNLVWTLMTSVVQFQAGRPAEGGRYLARAVQAHSACRQWATQVPALAPYRELPEFKRAITSR